MLQDEVVGEHLAGVDAQQLQDLELVLGEVDLLPVQEHLVLGDVHRQVLDVVDVLLGPLAQPQAVGPAQGGAHPGQHLRHAEGLDDVVVRPHVQGLHLFRLPVPGGDDDDRGLLGQAAELLKDLHAVHVGQPQVQQDQVGAVGEKQGEPLLPAEGRNGFIVVGVQRPADKVADGALIFDDQDHTFLIHP